MQIISPKYDFSFKELLSNEVVRKYLICDILDMSVEDVQSVRMINPFLWKRYRWQKQGILDVLVELNDTTKINLELQVSPVKYWDKRSLFYLSKMFTDDLRIGEKYQKLKRTIHVGILDFNLLQGEQYHTVYRLRDETGKDFTDLLEIHIIELRKKLKGTDRLDDWIRLFNAEKGEDLDMINTKNMGIMEAVKEIKEMSLSKRFRLRHEAIMKEIRDKNAREEYVRDEGIALGIERGIQEGIERGRTEEHLNLIRLKLAKGQSIEQIAEVLETTPEYVRELVKELSVSEEK